MFGLMKSLNCCFNEEIKNEYKLHYCSICKSIGKCYTHKSRFFLNVDIVFLSELLSLISGERKLIYEWNNSFHSRNCFELPSKNNIPPSLKYPGTLNIILAQLKVDDNISDSVNKGKYFWKIIQATLKNEFKKAERQMEEWSISVDSFLKLSCLQKIREQESNNFNAPEHYLNYFSESTAIITGSAFENGAKVIGKTQYSYDMYKMGYCFGKLIYLIDAIEDYSKDIKNKTFNAVSKAFNVSSKELNFEITNNIINMIYDLKNEINSSLASLPIPADKIKYFQKRLNLNLNRRLKVSSCSNSESIYNIDLSKPGDRENNSDIKPDKKRSSKYDLCCCDCPCDDVASCGCDCCSGADCGACDCCSGCDCSC